MSHNWICERCQESVVASGSRSDVALFSPFGCNKAQQTAARVGKGPQRVQVFPNPPNVEADVGILEIEVNTRGLLVPELAVGAIGLLLREPTNPRKKETRDDVAIAQGLVVFVLQARLGHGVKEAFPANDLQVEPSRGEHVVLLARVEFERTPVPSQVGWPSASRAMSGRATSTASGRRASSGDAGGAIIANTSDAAATAWLHRYEKRSAAVSDAFTEQPCLLTCQGHYQHGSVLTAWT
jgi:hypothetical protein